MGGVQGGSIVWLARLLCTQKEPQTIYGVCQASRPRAPGCGCTWEHVGGDSPAFRDLVLKGKW